MLSVRVPPRRVREKFLITYELYGAQKAVTYLTEYHHVRRMRIVLDGKRVGRTYVAYYEDNRALFTKRGLNRRTVLHEFYHHILSCKKIELSERIEEKESNAFAREFLKVCS